MADTFYSLNKGQSFGQVTVGAATSGQSVELRVHTGDGITKAEALRMLAVLEGYLATASEPI